jgi:Tfp pilus assembly protein PilN
MDEKGGTVVFDGSGATIDDVSAFMTALQQTPYFSKVELKKTTAVTRGGMRIVDFIVTAQANYTPGASAPAAPAKR